MKKFSTTTFLIFCAVFGAAQEKKQPSLKMYWSTDAQFAVGLKKIIADVVNTENTENFNSNAGITSIVGFQPIQRIGMGIGIKYNYFNQGFSTLYFLAQPKVYFQDDYEGGFAYLNAGFALNNSEVRSAKIYGIGLGDQNPINAKMSYFYTLFLENHRMDLGNGLKNNLYLGLQFGFILHSYTSH